MAVKLEWAPGVREQLEGAWVPWLPAARAKPALIGNGLETGRPVTVEDEGRCGGVYILGQPRTGKSTLLVSLALGDIENNHGLIFIDPHGDAITDLMSRIPDRREQDVILLDPTDKKYSFGINLLQCSDPTDEDKLDETYGRVRDIFAKVWGDEKGDLGKWFEKVLRGAVLLLLENQDPGYTLVDLPLLLREDATFRNHLLENVRIKPEIKDFWYDEFNRLSRREQTEQVSPVLNQIGILRDIRILRHIVGQSTTTINLREIINSENKIILVRIPASNPNEKVREFIGTLVVSEVLNAALNRDKLRKEDRRFFGVYCDEFHNFATQEFAKLFTETGKYKIMPVVAHHERMGQFKPGDLNRAATSAAPNKVFFRLSPDDAKNFAVEFAKSPPTETKLEREIVISREPVAVLLRGHNNPDICDFVTKNFRVMYERREDIKEDIEVERLIGQDLRDEAMVHQLGARMEGAQEPGRIDYSTMQSALASAQNALLLARGQTTKVFFLLGRAKSLRVAIRGLNECLTEVMEGKLAPGQERFSNYLIQRVKESPRVPEIHAELLKLYISLAYGDSNRPRSVSASLAIRCGLWPQECQGLLKQHELDRYESHSRHRQPTGKTRLIYLSRKEIQEAVYKEVSEWRISSRSPGTVLTECRNCCLFFHYYPAVRKLLTPYLSARFSGAWKGDEKWGGAFPCKTLLHDNFIDELIETFPKTFSSLHRYWWEKDSVVKEIASFLRQHGEGAIVVLALLDAARGTLRSWRARGCLDIDGRIYGNFHMLEIPAIVGKEPLEIFLLVKQINEILVANESRFGVDFVSSFEFQKDEFGDREKAECIEKNFYVCVYQIDARSLIANLHPDSPPRWDWWMKDAYGEVRPDARLLITALIDTLNKRKNWIFIGEPTSAKDLLKGLGLVSVWKECNDITRMYLIIRACDIVFYGEAVADYTYPQPTIKGATKEQVSQIVTALVDLRRKAEMEGWDTKRKEWLGKELVMFNEGKIPGYHLPERTLTDSEIDTLKKACEDVLGRLDVKSAIDDFVSFCILLSKPENHVRDACGQYVERQVNTRHHKDMADEMEQEMLRSAQGTAYAKIIHQQNGEQQVITEKIKTLLLPAGLPELAARDRNRRIEQNSRDLYYKPRVQIEEEVRQRREKWRGGGLNKPPPRIEGRGDEAKVDKPPPSRY